MHTSKICSAIVSVLALMVAWSPSAGAADPASGSGRNTAEMKFVTFPGLPTCTHGSVQNGDPGKGPSILYAKTTGKCVIPWHWHTPNEHLMIVTGSPYVEMKDGKPLTLHAGAFVMMPSHHVHQLRCNASCSFYVYSDGAFDLHYVDGKGTEIAPADALKAAHETVATEMKPVS